MADFLAGMLIGYRQQIPQDIQQDFRRTGTLHVFAVSGQNITEMLVVAILLLQLVGLVRWRWAWTLAPLVLTYCLLTGSPASAVRATVMALTVLLVWRLGRPLNALGCWSIAFLAMLIWDPRLLLDAGAQLSFGVVLGLILFAPPLAHGMASFFRHDPLLPTALLSNGQRREEKIWFRLALLVGAALVATLVSEPITAIDFHQVTPISILANLIVVPLAGLITMVGTLSVAVSLVSSPLAALLNNANWLFAKLLILFVSVLAHLPGASLNFPDLRALRSPQPSFVIAPVQDSASLLVRIPGHPWLVNTGREVPAPATVGHLLQFYGVNRLEGLILAQTSTADNGGAAAILHDYRPRRVILPPLERHSPIEKEIEEVLKQTGVKAETWQQGVQVNLGSGVDLEVLNPARGEIPSHVENRSLALLFCVQGKSLLWAGKIDVKARQTAFALYPDLRANILVLDATAPPSSEWLRELGVDYWLQIPPRDRQLNMASSAPTESSPCAIWPLPRTGAVEIHFEPTGIRLQPWLAAPETVP